MRSRLVLAAAMALLVFSQTVFAENNSLNSPIMQGNTTDLQPSYENNTMYLFGKGNANPCWGHFNNTDEGSDATGYGGESSSSGRLSISWKCRMDPILNVDFELKLEQTIDLNLYFEAYGTAGSGCGDANPCKNLNLTFTKGGKPVAEKEVELNNEQGPFVVNWAILVTEEIMEWKKSEDNPMLEIEVDLEPTQGLFGVLGSDAEFYIYYTHPDENREYPYSNSEGDNSTIVYPIVENSVVDPETEMGGNDGDVEESPGFGILIAGASVLWAAVFLNKRKLDDE